MAENTTVPKKISAEEIKQFREALDKFCLKPEIEDACARYDLSTETVKAMISGSYKGLKQGETIESRINTEFAELMHKMEIKRLYEKKAEEELAAQQTEKANNEKLPLFEDLKKVIKFPKDILKAIMTGEYLTEEDEQNASKARRSRIDAEIVIAEKKYMEFIDCLNRGEIITDIDTIKEITPDKITPELVDEAAKKTMPQAQVGVMLGSLKHILDTKPNLPDNVRQQVEKAIQLIESNDVEKGIKVAAIINKDLAKYNEKIAGLEGLENDGVESEVSQEEVQPEVETEGETVKEGEEQAEWNNVDLGTEVLPEGRKPVVPNVTGANTSKNKTEMEKLVQEFETLDFKDTVATMIWIADYARLSSNGAKVPAEVRGKMVEKFEANGYPSNTTYQLPRYIDLTEEGRVAYLMTCASRLIGGKDGIIDEKNVGVEAEAIILKKAPDKALPDDVLGVESYDPTKPKVDRNKQSEKDKILQEQIDKLMEEVGSVDFSNPEQALAWMNKFGKLAGQMDAPADIDKDKLNDVFKTSGINTREGAARLYSPNTKNIAEAELWAVTIGAGQILQDGQFPNSNEMNKILEAKGIIEPEADKGVEAPKTAVNKDAESKTTAVESETQEPLPESGVKAVRKVADDTMSHGYSDKDGRRITEEMRRDLHPEIVAQLEEEKRRQQEQEQEEFDEHDPLSKFVNGR